MVFMREAFYNQRSELSNHYSPRTWQGVKESRKSAGPNKIGSNKTRSNKTGPHKTKRAPMLRGSQYLRVSLLIGDIVKLDIPTCREGYRNCAGRIFPSSRHKL